MISVLQSLSGAQFLNATCVGAASGFFLWGSSPAAAVVMVLVTAISPATKIYASE